jgi:pimeloyl-ACP methyl ester carboxylesterase
LEEPLRAAFVVRVAERTQSSLAELDMFRVARAAPCALLVFHDPEDGDASYAASAEVVAQWAGARLVPCPGRGHYRILATPEIARQAVEFIGSLR